MLPKFNIRLNIAGKSYALSIERDKEEIFRRAEKEVNQRMAVAESQYVAQREDYLSVVALQLAVRNVELEASRALGDEVDKLEQLDRLLEQHLGKLK